MGVAMLEATAKAQGKLGAEPLRLVFPSLGRLSAAAVMQDSTREGVEEGSQVAVAAAAHRREPGLRRQVSRSGISTRAGLVVAVAPLS